MADSFMLPSPTTGQMLHAVRVELVFHRMFMADTDDSDAMWGITERYMEDRDTLVLLFADQWRADDYDDIAGK